MDKKNKLDKTTNMPPSTNMDAGIAKKRTANELIETIFEIAKYEFHALLKKNNSLTFHDAEDVISKSILKIYVRIKKSNDIKLIRAYTKRTMANVAIDFLKEKSKRKTSNLDIFDQMSIDEVKSIRYKKIDRILYSEKNQIQQEFSEFITKKQSKIAPYLNKTEKKVLEALKITHNKNQIAQELGISLRQISKIFKKILQTIKKIMDIENEAKNEM